MHAGPDLGSAGDPLHQICGRATKPGELHHRANESACSCIEWRDREIIPLGSETANLLEEFRSLRQRTACLKLVQCICCEQYGYVAADTVDDDYYFRRLDPAGAEAVLQRDEWPKDFDAFSHVWPQPERSGPVQYPWSNAAAQQVASVDEGRGMLSE